MCAFSLGIVEIIISKEVGWPEHVACMKNGMAVNLERKMSSGRIRNGLEDDIRNVFYTNIVRQCGSN
jgi:hypothetical protein